jgi:hypothetical protein
MAGYDPKQKRAHSPAAADEKAPVDDLLGPPPTPVEDPDVAPETTGPEVAEPATPLEPAVDEATAIEATESAAPVVAPARPAAVPAPSPAPSNGPDPKVLALVAAAVAAVVVWRWRRR